jgi:hypothetical protein
MADEKDKWPFDPMEPDKEQQPEKEQQLQKERT